MTGDIELSQPITIQGDNGAAVSVTINMNGKKLTDKTSVGQTTAGCIFIVPSGSTLNLSNGSIADVSNITGNNTKYIAGAIVNDGTATLSSVTISGCKGLLGGAIKNNQGAKLNLNTCTFDSNEARTKDGFDSGNGGGIWNGSGSKLSIQGANTVTDNNGLDNADNVFLTNGIVIAVTGSLAGSQIGVSMATPDVFTSGFGANNDKEPLTYFLSDDSGFKIVASDNEAKLVKDMETGIETMSDVRGQMSDVWYDLNGRRLEMKPATKGVYINNGCKVVIK